MYLIESISKLLFPEKTRTCRNSETVHVAGWEWSGGWPVRSRCLEAENTGFGPRSSRCECSSILIGYVQWSKLIGHKNLFSLLVYKMWEKRTKLYCSYVGLLSSKHKSPGIYCLTDILYLPRPVRGLNGVAFKKRLGRQVQEKEGRVHFGKGRVQRQWPLQREMEPCRRQTAPFSEFMNRFSTKKRLYGHPELTVEKKIEYWSYALFLFSVCT